MTNHGLKKNDLSLELTEAIGRLLIVGFEGQDLAEMAELVTQVRPAGLIFFKRNYPEAQGPRQLRATLTAIQELARQELGRELFLAIDHEGGRVQRLPAPYTHLPAPGAARIAMRERERSDWGGGVNECSPGQNHIFGQATMDFVEPTRIIMEKAARELAATGFNFNLAPVLDVANGESSILGDRAFSDDPAQVAAWGQATVDAFHQNGLLGAGKHFPGLGAAVIDPHHELPTLDFSDPALLAKSLLPFRELTQNGLLAVMTTHALYPTLDPERPATFSDKIVGMLKGDMQFSGAVLTDDLEMGAVVKNYPLGEAAVAAIRAGHDLALICRKRDYIQECTTALAEAVQSGVITQGRLAEAHQRSDLLRQKLKSIWPSEETRKMWFEELLLRCNGLMSAS